MQGKPLESIQHAEIIQESRRLHPVRKHWKVDSRELTRTVARGGLGELRRWKSA
jgi:hypothetical protein